MQKKYTKKVLYIETLKHLFGQDVTNKKINNERAKTNSGMRTASGHGYI